MSVLNFVTAREPTNPLRVDLDYQQLVEQGFLKEKDDFEGLVLVLGTSPSWEELEDMKLGYSEKREKYVAQIRVKEDVLSTIWVARHHLFLTGDPYYMQKHVKGKNYFWNDEAYRTLPVVTDQFNDDCFKGYGLNGTLITLANSHYKSLFTLPLYSATSFALMADRRGKRVKEVEGSRRVWEKLEERDLAERLNWNGTARWRCLSSS